MRRWCSLLPLGQSVFEAVLVATTLLRRNVRADVPNPIATGAFVHNKVQDRRDRKRIRSSELEIAFKLFFRDWRLVPKKSALFCKMQFVLHPEVKARRVIKRNPLPRQASASALYLIRIVRLRTCAYRDEDKP